MESYRAEVAAAEAASVVGYREPHLRYRGNAAVLFVHGVVGARERNSINLVKLLPLKRRLRGIHDEHLFVVVFYN